MENAKFSQISSEAYRQFCKKYNPQPKPEKHSDWGSKKLANLKPKKKSANTSPGQGSLWEDWNSSDEAIRQVAEKFVLANCFDPKIASLQFEGSQSKADQENGPVPGIETPE